MSVIHDTLFNIHELSLASRMRPRRSGVGVCSLLACYIFISPVFSVNVSSDVLQTFAPTASIKIHDIPDTIMAGIHYNYMTIIVQPMRESKLASENFIRNASIRWAFGLEMPSSDDSELWAYSCLAPMGDRGMFEDDMLIADIFDEAVANRCVTAVEFCTGDGLDLPGLSAQFIAPLGVDVFNADVLTRGLTLYVQMDVAVVDSESEQETTHSLIVQTPLTEQSVDFQCPFDVMRFDTASDVISVQISTGEAALTGGPSTASTTESYADSLMKIVFTGNESFFDSALGEDSFIRIDSIFLFNFLNSPDAYAEISDRMTSGTLLYVTTSSDGKQHDVAVNTTGMRSACENMDSSSQKSDFVQLGCLYREVVRKDVVVESSKESVRIVADPGDEIAVKPWLFQNFMTNSMNNVKIANRFEQSLLQNMGSRMHRVVMIDPGVRWDADQVKAKISMAQMSDNVICVGIATVVSDVEQAEGSNRRLLSFGTHEQKATQRVMSELRLQKRLRTVYNNTAAAATVKASSRELAAVRLRMASRSQGRSLLGTCTHFSKLCDMEEWLDKFNKMKANALQNSTQNETSELHGERRLLAGDYVLEQEQTLLNELERLASSHTASGLQYEHQNVDHSVNLAQLADVGSRKWQVLNISMRMKAGTRRKPLVKMVRDIGVALRQHKKVIGVGIHDVSVGTVRVLPAAPAAPAAPAVPAAPAAPGSSRTSIQMAMLGRRLLQVEDVNSDGDVIINLETVITLENSRAWTDSEGAADENIFSDLLKCIVNEGANTATSVSLVGDPDTTLASCTATTLETAAIDVITSSCGTADVGSSACNKLLGTLLQVGPTLAVAWQAIELDTHPVALYLTAHSATKYDTAQLAYYDWQIRQQISTTTEAPMSHIVLQTENYMNYDEVYSDGPITSGTFFRIWVYENPGVWPTSGDAVADTTSSARKSAWDSTWKSAVNTGLPNSMPLTFWTPTFDDVSTFARPFYPDLKQIAVIYSWTLTCFYPDEKTDDPCLVSPNVMAELEAVLKLHVGGGELHGLLAHANVDYVQKLNTVKQQSVTKMRFSSQVNTIKKADKLQDALLWHTLDIQTRFEEVVKAQFTDIELKIEPSHAFGGEGDWLRPWIMVDGLRQDRQPTVSVSTHMLIIIIILCILAVGGLMYLAQTQKEKNANYEHLNEVGKAEHQKGRHHLAGQHHEHVGHGAAFQAKRMSLIIPPTMQ